MKIRKISQLLEKKRKVSGRNSFGRTTIKHRGGAHKRMLRKIDFKRNITYLSATVLDIQRDPNRSAKVALICYPGGILTYILAPEGIQAHSKLSTVTHNNITLGNHTPLKHILIGSFIFNLESKPGSGGKFIRAAGTHGVILNKEKSGYVHVKLPSGETRKFHESCFATIGITSNSIHQTNTKERAGQNRHLGKRPHVRGVAMNPIDHPHGGGEGKHGTGRPSVSFSGKLTIGKRTRKNKKSNFNIIKKRHDSF